VSTTPMRMPLPVVSDHAAGALIRSSAHCSGKYGSLLAAAVLAKLSTPATSTASETTTRYLTLSSSHTATGVPGAVRWPYQLVVAHHDGVQSRATRRSRRAHAAPSPG